MSALIPCRDDDGLGVPLCRRVCMCCSKEMGTVVCLPEQAGQITHSVCLECREGLERGETLVPGECLEGQEPHSRFGLAPADAGSPAPLLSPALSGADVVVAGSGFGSAPGQVNGPAGSVALPPQSDDYAQAVPAAASVTSFGERPVWSCVTGADFARSIRWARAWVNPLTEHIRAHAPKHNQQS